jgi:hypothetical protein
MNLRKLMTWSAGGRHRREEWPNPQNPALLSRPPSSSDMLPLKRKCAGGAEHSTAPLLLPPNCESAITLHDAAAEFEGSNTGLTAGGGVEGSAKARLLLPGISASCDVGAF